MAKRVEEDSGIDGARLRLLAKGLEGVAPAGKWWPYDAPFEIAVSAVLTQRARFEGARSAMERLREAGLLTPQTLSAAARTQVEACVRPAGFFRQKARALQEISSVLCSRFGGRIERAFEMPTDELRRELLSWRGVGEETADAVLLFAAKRPVFVVDAYALRLMRRFGVIGGSAAPSPEEVAGAWRLVLGLHAEKLERVHAAIVDFSKSTCRVRPLCSTCPMRESCAREGVSETAAAPA